MVVLSPPPLRARAEHFLSSPHAGLHISGKLFCFVVRVGRWVGSGGLAARLEVDDRYLALAAWRGGGGFNQLRFNYEPSVQLTG